MKDSKMKLVTVLIGLTVLLAGCAREQSFEAVYYLPGAGAEELNHTVDDFFPPPQDIILERTVSDMNYLRIYFRTTLQEVEAEYWLESIEGGLPVGMSRLSMKPRGRRLPALPRITQVTQLQVTLKPQSNLYGVQASELSELLSQNKDEWDIDEITEMKIRTETGDEIPVSELADLSVESVPSHVVREYDTPE